MKTNIHKLLFSSNAAWLAAHRSVLTLRFLSTKTAACSRTLPTAQVKAVGMKGLLLGAGVIASALGVAGAAQSASTSVYLTAPDDPLAITVHAVGDGKADDTAAIQAALDQASNKGVGGVVFLPSGRYRITRSLLIWPAVRLFGVGATRPVLVLGKKTPGFHAGVANMVVFTGGDQYTVGKVPVPVASAVPYSDTVRDANSATFYSALSNIDFEIGEGNPAAAAVRFRTAQHTFLSHIDFHLGSGLAGIYQAGNEADDLHFYGGRYGILTEKTSPAWQFTLIDSTFSGQRDAAIREHEAGLTLVNVAIEATPVGIEIDRGYGDWMWGKGVRFDRVSKAAIIISNENNAFTQVGFDTAVARNTPVFALFRDSGRTVKAPDKAYQVANFSYGMKVEGLGVPGAYATTFDAKPLDALPSVPANALKALPPVAEWASVHAFGATGDGKTDDTAAIQKAIDSKRVVYLPIGHYLVSDTIHLKPDTVLIGMHPSLTQLVLPDGQAGYDGAGDAKPLLESAAGGNAVISGFGLFTGTINPRATALMWRAGAESEVYDVRIHGGHGTNLAGAKVDPYAKTGTLDPQLYWDRQHPSIWVRDGGGGTFANVWSPDTFAQAGFYVSNTDTPGHVYELSAEHHLRAEIVLDGVKHWEFLAPQTEEEVRESQDTVSLDVRNSSDILFANYHAYRVTRTIKPAISAVRLFNSGDIRFRNVHVNGESGYATCDANGCGTYLRASKYPFENALQDVTRKAEVREREFASLDVPAVGQPAGATPSAPLVPVRKLEDGFYSIAGAAVDADGRLYFIDRRFQRIYSWSQGEGLAITADAPVDPINLAVDGSGKLMVLSSAGPEGTVYSLDPKAGVSVRLKPADVTAHAWAKVLVPGNIWINGEFRDQIDPKTYQFTTLREMFVRDVGTPKDREYLSPDGSLALPAFRVFQQGPADHLGWRFSDTLDAYGFVSGKPGATVYVSSGAEDVTYRGVIGEGGSLVALTPFANRGGESVVAGPSGKVYVANGQVFVYGADGKAAGRIDVPERPLQLIFGGKDGRTLFILTHHGLYAAQPE